MSPTYFVASRARRGYERLSLDQQVAFVRAKDRLVAGLRESPPSYHPSLRLKRHQASGTGVYELSFGDGGRALLRFGDEVREGMAHVEWLAIGGHEIVDRQAASRYGRAEAASPATARDRATIGDVKEAPMKVTLTEPRLAGIDHLERVAAAEDDLPPAWEW